MRKTLMMIALASVGCSEATGPRVVANIADPQHLSDVLREHRLTLVKQTGPSTAVARPR